jgi:hypothetical protein
MLDHHTHTCAIALIRAALPPLTEAPENLYIVLNALACLSAELIAGHSNRLDFFHLALARHLDAA